MKIRQVVAELFHADGRTGERNDMTKIIFAFRNFANEPKNVSHHVVFNGFFFRYKTHPCSSTVVNCGGITLTVMNLGTVRFQG